MVTTTTATTTTTTTTSTTKSTTTTATTTTTTTTTTAGKTSTANPTNTTTTTSASVPIIQCYSFKSGETFNKSGNLESHLCPRGKNACFENAVTGLYHINILYTSCLIPTDHLVL